MILLKYYTELTEEKLNELTYDMIRTPKKIQYLNIESAFDIETSSIIDDGIKVGLSYVWAFGLGDGNEIYYGRTWEEFKELIELLVNHFQLFDERRLIIYVHNLGYEFQFMRKYFEWENVFSVDERKPIKALTVDGIEFKDSYILSGYSLEHTARNLVNHNVKKLVGDLDYSLTRHSESEITEQEFGYIRNDIEIILAYINEQMDQYGNITKIPLTNTGRVRKYVRNNCYYTSTNHKKTNKGKYSRYRKLMNDLTLNKKDYIMLKTAFMGGFTHANARYQGKILENVTSIDFTSSYPAVMLSEMFPMSRGKEVFPESFEEFETLVQKYCLLFDIRLTGVQSKDVPDNYISQSKCRNLENPIINNGRVHSADNLVMTITDVDYRILTATYTWKTLEVRNVIRYHKGYLPKPIIESVLELYQDKTELKGVSGREVDYMLSKGMLNSTYGMMVTDIIQDTILYEDDDWETEPVDVDEKIQEYNESKNRFLYYPWGVWITAYARKNLWTGILNVGDDYIYSDTDSIKLLNYEKHIPFIEHYDNELIQRLNEMMEHYDLDKTLLNPLGQMIGVWDYEGTYSRFKTLGAKRYLVEENGELELTVAGLSKQNGVEYMLEKTGNDNGGVFKMFTDDLYIPAERTGKMTHTYIDEPKEITVTDYQGNISRETIPSGVHLENADYTLSISKQYGEFIANFIKGYSYKGVKHV